MVKEFRQECFQQLSLIRMKGVAGDRERFAFRKTIIKLQFLFWELQIGGEGRRSCVHTLVSTISLLAAFVSLVQPDRLQQRSVIFMKCVFFIRYTHKLLVSAVGGR